MPYTPDMGSVLKDHAQASLKELQFQLGFYRHYLGGKYVAFAVTLSEDTLEPLVHYYSVDKKTRWTRTLENWASAVEGGQPRFSFQHRATPRELIDAALDSLPVE